MFDDLFSDVDSQFDNNSYSDDITTCSVSDEENSRLSRLYIGKGSTFHPEMYNRSRLELDQASNILQEPIALQLKRHRGDGLTSEIYHDLVSYGYNINNKTESIVSILNNRKYNGSLGSIQQVHVCNELLPLGCESKLEMSSVDVQTDAIYCGEFTASGDMYLTAGKGPEIIVYDTSNWQKKHLIQTKGIHWSITDAHFTPDRRNVVYSTISNIVRMAKLDGDNNQTETVRFKIQEMDHYSTYPVTGIWCLDVDTTGKQFIAGTSVNRVVLYDMETKTTCSNFKCHSNDINAIKFVDRSCNVFISGSDDHLIKLWDTRMLYQTGVQQPQGYFLGHSEGIVHLSSKNDGRYFISNAKDQTCKLWDLRKMSSQAEYEAAPRSLEGGVYWDYRYDVYPYIGRPFSLPYDNSLMTYRGHFVLHTMIRAQFSPISSTGQNYIYCGSTDGCVYIYDVLSGALIDVFGSNSNSIVRSVNWHPYDPYIATTDFNGNVNVWKQQKES